jgi:N-acetylmuramoyl-L-alanine amidase
MKVIYLTAGHGAFANGVNYTDPRWGKFYHFTENGKRVFSAYEGETNRIFAKKFMEVMKGTGIEVIQMHHDLQDVPHNTQIQKANAHFIRNKPDKALWLSMHSNALGVASEGASNPTRGYSVWTSVGETQSDKIATLVFETVAPVCEKYKMPLMRQNWTDNDVDYEANFDELALTFMPAVLNELGFFTNIIDAKLLKNEAFQNEVVQAYKKAVLQYFN